MIIHYSPIPLHPRIINSLFCGNSLPPKGYWPLVAVRYSCNGMSGELLSCQDAVDAYYHAIICMYNICIYIYIHYMHVYIYIYIYNYMHLWCYYVLVRSWNSSVKSSLLNICIYIYIYIYIFNIFAYIYIYANTFPIVLKQAVKYLIIILSC